MSPVKIVYELVHFSKIRKQGKFSIEVQKFEGFQAL